MTARPALISCLGVALAAWLTTNARAEPEAPAPRWDPGHATTSRISGEVNGDDATGDGVYGRFRGSFDLGLNAGAEVREGSAAGAVGASLHYFFMAGVYAEYSDALGNDALRTERALSLGVDFRPAFIPRWSKGWESGPALFDVTVDSISLGLGAYFRQPAGGSFADRRGLEASLGFAIPLQPRAVGFFVSARGILRWDDPFDSSRSAANAAGLFALAYHAAL
jgi:hypothetical protein